MLNQLFSSLVNVPLEFRQATLGCGLPIGVEGALFSVSLPVLFNLANRNGSAFCGLIMRSRRELVTHLVLLSAMSKKVSLRLFHALLGETVPPYLEVKDTVSMIVGRSGRAV